MQSLFSLASGGLFGRGLGQGYLILQSGNPIIPHLESDFIFSAIGEELGLVGAMGIILLYLIFTYRGLRVAMANRDDFSRLLSTGLTSIFALQAFIIIGGVIKLIPLTGITLPFVSYGGSSVVANFVLLALLLRASDRAARDKQAGDPRAARPGRHGQSGGSWISPSAGSSTSSRPCSWRSSSCSRTSRCGRLRASRSMPPTPGPSRRR